jgi:hypothetical protein
MTYGHGHVVPRADGLLACCGGPAICSECARDQAFYAAGVEAAKQECDKLRAHCLNLAAKHAPTEQGSLMLAAVSALETLQRRIAVLLEPGEGETSNEPDGMQTTVTECGEDELRIDPRDLDGYDGAKV